MELEFIGAAHEVTGSCHYLHVGGCSILVDCGMEQGKNLFENAPLPVTPASIDYVFVTHAHIDHTGMLPRLYADGFRGQIICTEATRNLSDIMLRDSAHIQTQEAEYRSKKAGTSGGKEAQRPLYTMQDTMNVLQLFHAYPYDAMVTLCPEITFRFTDIGHLLGSASIELWLTERGETRKIVFSGDIGNRNQPLLRDPAPTASADYVVMESTYGTRLHEKVKRDHLEQLTEVIRTTLSAGGNVVIPAFAVGRTQVMMYFIRKMKAEGRMSENPDFPVYVDSPMAVEAVGVFERNERACYDEEAQEILKRGENPLAFPGLHLALTTQESMAINDDEEPKVILSASGMCDAGRIRHHIKHNIENPASAILFVGYQSEGTLGRRLLDGAEKVKLFGKEYRVRAKILQMDGFSGHADKEGLLEWIGGFTEKPRQVFVVHGDDETASAFADCLANEQGIKAMAPYSGTKYDLIKGAFIRIAKPRPIAGKTGEKVQNASGSYTKLRIAAGRLANVVDKAGGLPNKELDAFTKELNDLCRRYGIVK